MINISIRNFGGVARADLAIEKTCLLAGANFAGKTSACRAVAAALSGRVIPLTDLKKSEAAMLVRTGEAEASVSIGDEGGQVKVTWPAAERSTNGKPPEASVFATGLDTIIGMDAKQRATALAPYLQAEPTHEDLHALLKDGGVTDDIANRIWAKVRADGWDAMHKVAKDYGARLKGEWQQIAGTDYGDRKAAAWMPANWSDDLAGIDLESLERAADLAKRALEEAIKGAAIDADKVARLKHEAALLPGLQKTNTELAAAIITLDDKIEKLTAERAVLPPATADSGLPCPHCKKKVRMHQEKPGVWAIAKVEDEITPTEKKKRGDAIAVADGQLSNYRDKLTAAKTNAGTIEREIGVAERAAKEFAGIKDKTGDAGAADNARAASTLADQRIAAAKAKREADGKVAMIRQYQAITAALAPDGLRKTALARGLDAFNKRLADLCVAAKWKAVTIEPDLWVRYGGRPYLLLSASEQYRTRATLAAAMAQIDGSAMLIFDGADILDTRGRNGLFGIITAVGLPALLTMTISRATDVPDLAVGGFGSSFWLTGDVVKPLADVVVQAEAA